MHSTKNLFAGAKILACVIIPVYAALTTLRVMMTYAGLDQVMWGDWFPTLVGPGGVTLMVPVALLVVLTASGHAERAWRGIVTMAERAPGLLAKIPTRSLLTTLLWGAAIIGFPVIGLMTMPEAWTHWVPWVLVAFSPLILSLAIGFVFKPQELFDSVAEMRNRRALVAFGVKIVVMVGVSWLVYDMHASMAEMGILWITPLIGAFAPLMFGSIASGFVARDGRADTSSPTSA